MEELLYFRKTDKDIISIEGERLGKIGDLFYNEDLAMWLFLPKKHFFYKPVHLALILSYCNELNGYKSKKRRYKNDYENGFNKESY